MMTSMSTALFTGLVITIPVAAILYFMIIGIYRYIRMKIINHMCYVIVKSMNDMLTGIYLGIDRGLSSIDAYMNDSKIITDISDIHSVYANPYFIAMHKLSKEFMDQLVGEDDRNEWLFAAIPELKMHFMSKSIISVWSDARDIRENIAQIVSYFMCKKLIIDGTLTYEHGEVKIDGKYFRIETDRKEELSRPDQRVKKEDRIQTGRAEADGRVNDNPH